MAKRNIETKYFIGRTESKITRSVDPHRAVAKCVLNMQRNEYGADFAEVWDLETGKVYAQIKFFKRGHIDIIYARNPRPALPRIA
jgi:hypothetical protein